MAVIEARAWGRRAIRLAVSGALIAWVLRGVDLSRVGEVVAGANVPLIVVAFLSYFVGYVASVARWRVLLAAQGVTPRFSYLYWSFMVGMFFNQLLPSTIGGDLARYKYTAAGGRGAALSAVLLDRAFGSISLVAFAALGFALSGSSEILPARLPQTIAVLLCIGLVALAFAFCWPEQTLRPARRAIAAWPQRLRERLEGLFDAAAAFGGRYDVIFAALSWSLVLQTIVIGHYYAVGVALGLNVPLHAYAFIVPLAIVVMALPISVNGIGVREGILGYLLGLHGVDPNTSLVFAWVLYAMLLAHGLLGGIVFAVLRAARHGEIGPPAGAAEP
jgi:uncharacterized protein (TIRG00374 family)